MRRFETLLLSQKPASIIPSSSKKVITSCKRYSLRNLNRVGIKLDKSKMIVQDVSFLNVWSLQQDPDSKEVILLDIHRNYSCPKCNCYKLKKVHRRFWMKLLFKSKLFECLECHEHFLKWSIYNLDIKKTEFRAPALSGYDLSIKPHSKGILQ